MDERKNEIGFVLSMIQNLCEEAQIALVAKELKGTFGGVILDARYVKEYVMEKVVKTNA